MGMAEIVCAENFDVFNKYWNEVSNGDPPVFFYFTGSKNSNGVSWCPDCVEAEPIIDKVLAEISINLRFIKVDVGDAQHWRSRECPFRTDTRTHLMVIPTIIKWNGVQRLEGSQCNKPDLLKLLFEESDE